MFMGATAMRHGENYKNRLLSQMCFSHNTNQVPNQVCSYLMRALELNPEKVAFIDGKTANAYKTENKEKINAYKTDGTVYVTDKNMQRKSYNVSIKSSPGSIQIAAHSWESLKVIFEKNNIEVSPEADLGMKKFLGVGKYALEAQKKSKYADNRRRMRLAWDELSAPEQKAIEKMFTDNFDLISDIFLGRGGCSEKQNFVNLYCLNKGAFVKDREAIDPYFIKMETILDVNRNYAFSEYGKLFQLGKKSQKRGITGFWLGMIQIQMAGNKGSPDEASYHNLQVKLRGKTLGRAIEARGY